LRGEEDEVSKQARRSAVPVDEAVDADGLGMHRDAEFPRCPVVGVLPPVPDVVERSAELNGDALGGDADVEIARSVPTRPRPQVAVELLMQVAEERVREEVGKRESPVGDVVENRDADLIVDRLLSLVELDLRRLITEDLASLRSESIRFLRLQRCFAVVGLDTHQACCLRAMRKRSTRSERTALTGTDLFSNAADARVERMAARRSASCVTFLRFMCSPPADRDRLHFIAPTPA
jgi:hypothetical protein